MNEFSLQEWVLAWEYEGEIVEDELDLSILILELYGVLKSSERN